MNPLKTFIKDPVKTCYDGEDADEKILYVLRASQLTNIPWILLTALFASIPTLLGPAILEFIHQNAPSLVSGKILFSITVFWYLFTFSYFFQSFLNWFFNVYVITNKKILDMDFRGVLYKHISETTLDNIEDMTSQVSGTLGVVFNIGDVYIQTAGEVPEFDFENLDDPAKVRDILADLVLVYKKGTHDHDNN